MLPSDGAPVVSGGSSAPPPPKTVADLSNILYGTKGTSTPVSGGGGLNDILQSPSTKNGNAQTNAGVKQAKVISDNTNYAKKHGIVATQSQLSDPNFISKHPVAAVKSVAIGGSGGSSKTSGGGSGLASPSSLASLAGMANGGMSSSDINKQATDLVTAQYQPLIDELNRQLQEDKTVYGQQSSQVKADQARLDSNVEAIYNMLRNQIVEEQGTSDKQYGQTQQNVGSSFDQLQGHLNSIYGNAGHQLNGDMNQLGLQGAADNYGNHSLVDNYKLLSSLADTNKTATMGNLTTEGQGFHTLLGSQATQATATGNDQRSIIATTAQKELIQLKNNLQNQLDQINKQKANIQTEKGQQIAAEREKLTMALAQTNNQLAIATAKLNQGQQRIDISKESLAQRINQNTFSDNLALAKLQKMGGSAAQNKTKLGNAETTLSSLIPNSDEAGAALNWLAGGQTKSGVDLLTLATTKGLGAVPTSDLKAEAQALHNQYGGDVNTILQALKYALLGLAGYGTTG